MYPETLTLIFINIKISINLKINWGGRDTFGVMRAIYLISVFLILYAKKSSSKRAYKKLCFKVFDINIG